jgi:hypothetical protein
MASPEIEKMADFQSAMVAQALAMLTPRQIFVLEATAAGADLVRCGIYAYVGDAPTSVSTINALLAVCALSFDEVGTSEYYRINETGMKILEAFKNLAARSQTEGGK